jgi:hypothetical protein
VVLQEPPRGVDVSHLQCYPNPFNPVVNIRVQHVGGKRGTLQLCDAAGRVLRRYSIDGLRNAVDLQWYADGGAHALPGSGVYFLRLEVVDEGGRSMIETAKIIHAK